MKKSIFNLALLSMLFVLGACSTTGNDKDTGGGTGDPALDAVIDEAIKDAITQIGSVEGMDSWSSSYLLSEEEKLETIYSGNLYFSTGEYKFINAGIYNGFVVNDDGSKVTFDNELSTVRAVKGTLAVSTDFKLFDNTGAEIKDKKGYTTLYTQTFTKDITWCSAKSGGLETWEDSGIEEIGYISYTIIKKTDTELSMISVSLKTTGKPEDGYKIYGTMDEEIAEAITYTKK